jgi:hypothetical protein
MKTPLNLPFIPVALLALASLSARLSTCHAQGTAFTYQGRLDSGSSPANGIFDLQFAIYDTAGGGALVAGPLTNAATAVSNGLFTVTLDFGAGVFTGADRWLEIAVRTNGGGAFTVLAPRQAITPAPYALNAANLTSTTGSPLDIKVGDARALRLEAGATSPNLLGGFAGNVVSNGVAGATISGGGTAFIDGTNGLNRVTDNYGAVGGGANNQAGNGNANPADAENATVGGGLSNTASGSGSTVGGGYRNLASGISSTVGGGALNRATNNDAVVAGGFNNSAGYRAAVGGGEANTAAGVHGVVGGGYNNQNIGWLSAISGGDANFIGIYADHSTISGGGNNAIVGSLALPVYGAVGGGRQNRIETNVSYATIAGGFQNRVETNAHYAAIGGGSNNTANVDFATVGGGAYNTASGEYATVGGGGANRVASANALISGGNGNLIDTNSQGSVIGGGTGNKVGDYAHHSTIGGGFNNTNDTGTFYATIGGGVRNLIQSGVPYCTIGGGYENTVRYGSYSTIAGGYQCVAGYAGFPQSGQYASVGGGDRNNAHGDYSTVPGGALNWAPGAYSFAAGRQAKAVHTGAFVWADASGSDFYSVANNEVAFRCGGGVRFTSSIGSASWTPGSGSWTFMSDRNVKERFEKVDVQSVLERVSRLPISEWNYTGCPQRHIGPMAQDFHALFPLNDNDRMLNDADLHGVALAAIQGLNEKVEVRSQNAESQIRKLAAENAELKERLSQLEHLVRTLAAPPKRGGR